MIIKIHPHAKERMQDRGASENEVIKTVKQGEEFPAKFGRIGFRCNFALFNCYYSFSEIFLGGERMKLSYDPRYNIGYIQLREKSTKVETIHISDELNIDISPDGKIYGIELLNANEQLQIIKEGKFTFTDESTGKTVQIPVTVEKS